MNENGMKRTIEVNGDASVQVTGCNTITVDVSEKVSVSIDGEPASVENGQAVSSFVAEAAESSVKVKDFAVEAACGKTNELSGTVYADLISNSIDEQNVTFNLEFFDSSKRLVSFSTKKDIVTAKKAGKGKIVATTAKAADDSKRKQKLNLKLIHH